MIQFDNVVVARGGKTILDGVTLKVDTGEKVALAGKSGSGKSTILGTLVGAYEPASGKVTYDNLELTPQTVRRVREAIAFIGQEPALGADTVEEALLLPFTFHANHGTKPSEKSIAEVLEKLHLSHDILKSKATVISGGEKQRVAIARALLMKKRVFLADEVTSALDPVSKKVVIEIFSQPDLTVLSVSHDADWICHCDRVLTLDAGRIVDERSIQ